jgi:quercetin dioxygenase-like cupin family protein
MRTGKAVAVSTLIASMLVLEGVLSAQGPQGQIEEVVALDNDSVRVALLTFPPGSASGRHINIGPEMGIMLEGELTLVTPTGRELLGPGTVHYLPILTPHDARNEGNRPAKLWALLLKKCD